MNRSYWNRQSKYAAVGAGLARYAQGIVGFLLMVLSLIVFFLALVVPGHAQTIRANQFVSAGITQGARITAAQNACFNTSMPCVIVLDPEMAILPAGTAPSRCTNCVWVDYRTAGQFSINGTSVLSGSSTLTCPTEASAPAAPASGDTLYCETGNGFASISAASVKKYLARVQAAATNTCLTGFNADGTWTTGTCVTTVANTLADKGGLWMPTATFPAVIGASEQVSNAANTVRVMQVVVPFSQTVGNMSYNVTVASGNCDFGLYDVTGATLLVHMGATAIGTGVRKTATTAQVVIAAGTYLWAQVCDNITARIYTGSNSGIPEGILNSGTAKKYGTAANAATAGALPASTGAITAELTFDPTLAFLEP